MCVCVYIYIFGKAWQLLFPCSDKCLFSYLLPLISFILFQIFSLKSKYRPRATQSFSMILQNMWIYSSSIYVLSIGFLVSFLLSTSKSNTNILPFAYLDIISTTPEQAFVVCSFIPTINCCHSLFQQFFFFF